MRIKFKEYDCVLHFSKYSSGHTAIYLSDANTGEPVIKCTLNLPDSSLSPDEVLIKNYSENEGVLECLEAAGVIERTDDSIVTGWVDVPVCRLLIDPREYQNNDTN